MTDNPDCNLKEDLVAYLDGELDEQASQAIEQMLAQSPSARREVEALTGTWELLEVLPEVKASDEFTQETLSAIRATGDSQPMQRAAWKQRTRQGRLLAVWTTGLVLCSAFGYLLTNQWIPHESDELFRELSLIENLHVYSEIDDVQFLRDLQESNLFNEESSK